MKPLSTNNLSAWGYIGLLILFNLPYIGTPALIICAIFARDHSTKSFARAILIIELICLGLIIALGFLGFYSFSDLIEDFYFSVDDGTEVFNNIRYYLGA